MTAIYTANAPIVIHLSPQQRDIIEQAAALTGQNLDFFVTTAILEKAHQVMLTAKIRQLSARDAERFLEQLDSDLEPNEPLKTVAQRYRKHHG